MTTAERMRAMRDRARQAAIFETDWASASDTRLLESAGHLMRDGRPALLARVAVEMLSRANARRLDVAGAVELDWRVVDPSRSSEPSESVDQGEPIQGSEPVEAVESSASNPSEPMVSVTVTNGEPVDQGELFALPSILFAMPVEPTRASEPVESKPSRSSASHVEPVDQGKGSREYPAEPVASKPSASKGSREYPAETKARAVLAYKQGMKARDVRALIKAECGEDPDSNLAKNIRAWEQQAAVVAILAKLETEHCKTQ